jgi:hypothetical protein
MLDTITVRAYNARIGDNTKNSHRNLMDLCTRKKRNMSGNCIQPAIMGEFADNRTIVVTHITVA